jgi:predicted ester cyclase
LFGNESGLDPAEVKTVSELNKEKVRLFADAVLNGGQLELIDELIAADYLGHVRCLGHTVIGPAGVHQLVSSQRCTHPELRFTIADLVAEDDRVAVRWQARASPHTLWEGLTIIRFLAGRQVDAQTECTSWRPPPAR